MIGSNPQQHLVFLLVLVVGLFSCSVQSMRFDLKPGLVKCIAEDIKKNSMTVGNYSIVNPNEGQPLSADHTITVQVSTHGGTAKHHFAEHVQSGQFAFVAHQSGDYLVCFWGDKTQHDSQETLSIDFVWKTGVAAKDWSKIAKKGHIYKMELEVQMLQETAMSIKEEMSYLRERGFEVLDLDSTTNTRMLWMSFVSFLICFSVAGLQLWHLKTFFKKNKIL